MDSPSRASLLIIEKGIFKMKDFLTYTIIILGFWITGKAISLCDWAFFKKIIKSKRHVNASDRMVNNYWGNMISFVGIVIVVGMILDITSFEFFGIIVLCIVAAYTFHISNVTGGSLDDAVSYVISGNDKAVKQYMPGTACAILSVIAAGMVSSFIVAPYIFKSEKNEDAASGQETYMIETTKDKEAEFLETIKESFK